MEDKEMNYENYKYNPECVFSKQEEEEKENRKPNRLSKQLGDFGEQFVITLLGRLAKYKVILVDHEGADLIATKDDKKYAISVKARQFGPSESSTITFTKDSQEKLCKFAKAFDAIPAVSLVLMPRDLAYIDVYINA